MERRRHRGVKDPDQNLVVPGMHLSCQIEGEGRVPALMFAHRLAVDPHLGKVVHSAEMNQLPGGRLGLG